MIDIWLILVGLAVPLIFGIILGFAASLMMSKHYSSALKSKTQVVDMPKRVVACFEHKAKSRAGNTFYVKYVQCEDESIWRLWDEKWERIDSLPHEGH